VNTYRLAVIPGDGIGVDVTPVGLAVIERVGEITGSFAIEPVEYPWSCQFYLRTGMMMPPDALTILADHDAILLGAVGFPGVPDHISVSGLVLPIRQGFDQYVNLRPVQLFEGVPSRLAGRGPADIDMVCVRENTQGEYSGIGGRLRLGDYDEVATDTSVFTRKGVERVARYAFELARTRRRKVASATKSNALRNTSVLWDEVVARVAQEYQDVELTSYLVDALAARFITHPQTLDVVVGSNLFGDILTDIGSAIQGSIGMGASANLDPTRRHPSMFEPIHGSAPDIAGQGIANPVGTIWASAMLLTHLGELEGSELVMRAMRQVLRDGPRTPDLGGTATTSEVGQAVVAALNPRPIATTAAPDDELFTTRADWDMPVTGLPSG
jgi:tartrate dehydrogenase/decarboxylase/D-malate dehydrogenase